jgi:Na+/H+ antiporter NhaD/arsenite permease-like protein
MTRLILCFAVLSCAFSDAAEKRPNVLLLVSDDLAATLGCYGYPQAKTPHLDALAASGVYVYPLWWGLNVGTSIGGAGSMIGAACNVIALDQAAKESYKVGFTKYLRYGVPLVLCNSLVAFIILALRYLV